VGATVKIRRAVSCTSRAVCKEEEEEEEEEEERYRLWHWQSNLFFYSQRNDPRDI